jgi:hypothetical protein
VLRRRAATPAHAAFLDVVLQRIDAVAMRRVARTMTGVIDVAATAEDKVTRHNVQLLTLFYDRVLGVVPYVPIVFVGAVSLK